MTKQEYRALFVDDRYKNLDTLFIKDHLIYLVQEYRDDILNSDNAPFVVCGIIFEPEACLYGIDNFEYRNNPDNAYPVYTTKEFARAIISGNREALLILGDTKLLSNTCGEKFIAGIKEHIGFDVDRLYLKRMEDIWKHIDPEGDLNEIRFEAYNDLKSCMYLLNLKQKHSDISLTDNEKALLKYIYESDSVSEIIAKLNSFIYYSSQFSLHDDYIEGFIMDFLKDNLKRKRKVLLLKDIKH